MQRVPKIILVGQVAADPKLPPKGSVGFPVTFLLATYRDYSSDGATKEVVDYHKVACWGALADMCAKYLRKGRGVYVKGTFSIRIYEKDGNRKYSAEIRADEVNMLTSKKKGGFKKVSLDSTPVSTRDHTSRNEHI